MKFVSPETHDYSDSLEAREEAGTPNVVGDIRAALAFVVKHAIGLKEMARRNRQLTVRAFSAWKDVPQLEILGLPALDRLPIFPSASATARGYMHQQLVTRMLSDRFGIQARGGCACAGPYVHRLLSIDAQQSEQMRQAILAGDEIKAGLHPAEFQRSALGRKGEIHPRFRRETGCRRSGVRTGLRLRSGTCDLLPSCSGRERRGTCTGLM